MRFYSSEYSGVAALSICESLLLALNDRKLFPEREIVGVLRDAATTHQNAVIAAGADADKEMHRAVAALSKEMISEGARCSRDAGPVPD